MLSDDITFLNIGANDGLSGDPVREFIILNGWKGVLVEPVPHVYERLRRSYAGVAGLRFEKVAIAEQNGSQKFWYLRKNNELPSGYDQCGSFDLENILKCENMFPGLRGYLDHEQVECSTLADLIRRSGRSFYHLIFIDAEGHDDKIVMQVDFDNPPWMIVFEHANLSPERHKACLKLLESKGYLVMGDEGNTVATRFHQLSERGRLK